MLEFKPGTLGQGLYFLQSRQVLEEHLGYVASELADQLYPLLSGLFLLDVLDTALTPAHGLHILLLFLPDGTHPVSEPVDFGSIFLGLETAVHSGLSTL